jgi:hypothetical protein
MPTEQLSEAVVGALRLRRRPRSLDGSLGLSRLSNHAQIISARPA